MVRYLFIVNRLQFSLSLTIFYFIITYALLE